MSVYGGKVQTRLSLLPSESGNITEQPTDRRQSVRTLNEDIIMALHTGDTSTMGVNHYPITVTL